MSNPHVLDPDLESIRNTHLEYETAKLFRVQEIRNLKRIAENADGDYSFTRLLQAQLHDNRRLAPLEFAASDKIAEAIGRAPAHGFAFVPISDRRDLTAAVAGAGGYLVSTQTAPGDMFVGFLHALSISSRYPLPRIRVKGNATTPRVKGSVTTGWLTNEGALLTESDLQFALAAAAPKTVGTYTEVSDLFVKQTSPAAQAFVLLELSRATAAAVNAALINGSGAAGQPTGLLNTAGIGSQAGAALAWGGVLNMVEHVEGASGLVAPAAAGWVVAPNVARLLRARERATGSGFVMEGNTINAAPALVTKGAPDGVAIFGDWSGLAMLEWGVLEVGVDPYGISSELFKKGLVGVRTLWTVDFIALRPASFSAATSIT